MAQPTPPCPALLLLAAFSRYGEALDWARQQAVERFGPVVGESPRFEFNQTDYYQPTMGPGLLKSFLVFRQPFDAGEMAEVKLLTNDWEEQYAAQRLHAEARPLNLDPGYLTLGKLVLASTKDHAHRVYLARGIYGEVTLHFTHGRWQSHPWTFADYRRDDYQAFFSECRDWLHGQIRQGGPQ